MTAPAFIEDHGTDYLGGAYYTERDYSQRGVGRPHLTLVDGGRDDHAASVGRNQSAEISIVRRESDMIEVYRRRRFVAALAIVVAVVSLALASGVSLTSFGAASAPADNAPLVHVVGIGDTYPSIAAEIGAENPNAFAATLRAANGGAELSPGQRLVLELGDHR